MKGFFLHCGVTRQVRVLGIMPDVSVKLKILQDHLEKLHSDLLFNRAVWYWLFFFYRYTIFQYCPTPNFRYQYQQIPIDTDMYSYGNNSLWLICGVISGSMSCTMLTVTNRNKSVCVPAGRVCDCHVSIRDAVDTHDQRGDAARSVRRHQVLPLPGHFKTLWPSGTLGSKLKVQSSSICYCCINVISLEGMFSFEKCNCDCVKFPWRCHAVYCLFKSLLLIMRMVTNMICALAGGSFPFPSQFHSQLDLLHWRSSRHKIFN